MLSSLISCFCIWDVSPPAIPSSPILQFSLRNPRITTYWPTRRPGTLGFCPYLAVRRWSTTWRDTSVEGRSRSEITVVYLPPSEACLGKIWCKRWPRGPCCVNRVRPFCTSQWLATIGSICINERVLFYLHLLFTCELRLCTVLRDFSELIPPSPPL